MSLSNSSDRKLNTQFCDHIGKANSKYIDMILIDTYDMYKYIDNWIQYNTNNHW